MLKLILFSSLLLIGFLAAAEDSSSGQSADGIVVPDVVPVKEDSYGAYEEDSNEDSYGDESYEDDSNEDSYNEDSYGDDSYDEDAYGEDSYEEDSYGEDSYEEDSYEEGPPSEEPTPKPRSKLDKIRKKYQKFVMKIWRELENGDLKTNSLYSPLSLFSTLATLRSAAGKRSRRQLNKVLKMKSLTSGDLGAFLSAVTSGAEDSYKLRNVNRVYLDSTLKFSRKFKDDVKSLKVVDKKMIDFSQLKEARAKMNKYVKRQTAGFIPKLIPRDAMDELTKVYFINALYLKATWDEKFDSATKGQFTTYLEDKPQVEVNMMRSRNSVCKVFGHGNNRDTQVLALPLHKGDLEMVFIMPTNEEDFNSFLSVENEKDNNKMIRLLGEASNHQLQTCDVTIPKFTLAHSVENMIATLKTMGVSELFEDETSMSRMLAKDTKVPLTVTNIQHKTKLVVDENGIEGAAATSVQVSFRMLPPMVRVNQPFYFLVRHTASHAVVFSGKVVDPSQLV